MNKLIIPVKQGEEFNIGFTIKAGEDPMDLTGYDVVVQVKEIPLAKAKPIINKRITVDSDMNKDGVISFPDQGQVTLHLTKEDTSIHTGEYYLIIALSADNYYDIISSGCYSEATFIVCEQ